MFDNLLLFNVQSISGCFLHFCSSLSVSRKFIPNSTFCRKKEFLDALRFRHCRGYLSIQRRRRVQPAPAAPAGPGNEGEPVAADEENQGEPLHNEGGNQRHTVSQCFFRLSGNVAKRKIHFRSYFLSVKLFL